jgi:hypothetical protein
MSEYDECEKCGVIPYLQCDCGFVQWISTSERLPEEKTDVIITVDQPTLRTVCENQDQEKEAYRMMKEILFV